MNFQKLGLLLIFGILLIWINTFKIASLVFGKQTFKNDIDPFSAVSALFSGLALTGVIVAIIYQQKELNLQRIEMQNTRAAFETERFEITFFNLLNNHRQIVSQINHKFIDKYSTKEGGKWVDKVVASETFSGIDFFKKVYEDFKNIYEMSNEVQKADGLSYVASKPRYVFPFNRYDDLSPYWLNSQIRRAKEVSDGLNLNRNIVQIITSPIFKEHKETFQYYFSNLIQSLIIINEFVNKNKNQVLDKEKSEPYNNKYLEILKAQLTTYELNLTFYYVIGSSPLQKLFYDVHFFNELDFSNLLNNEHKNLYCEKR